MFKKISFTVAVALVLGAKSYAQIADSSIQSAPKTTKTLFGALKPKVSTIGLYVAPEFQYFGAAGAYTPAHGASAMLLINQKLGIGASAASARNFTPTALNNAGLRMQYAYGGGQIEYTFAPNRLLHVSVPVLIGAGMARVDSTNALSGWGRGRRGDDNFNNFEGNQNSFFVLQPGLRIETNLFRFAKLYVGANYRAVLGNSSVSYPNGATTANLSNSQLSGASFTAGLKLGLFDYAIRKKDRS